MILRVWLVLVLVLVTAPLRAESGAQVFFFGNAAIYPAGGDDDDAVPLWLARMAGAAGVAFAADGTSGVPATFARDLPPAPDWRIDGVARGMGDSPRSFRMAGFDTVVLAPGMIDAGTAALVRRTFDWAGRQGVRRALLYEDGPGAAALVQEVAAGSPGPAVGIVPVASTMAALGLAPVDGTPDAALLAAMVTWSALFRSAAPEIALPDTVSAPLRDGYAGIAERIWLHVAGAVAPEGAVLTPPATGLADPSLAFGLAGIADWSTEMPFIDVMKTARPWIGHLPGQWGGVDAADLRAGGFLSPEGWPLAIPDGVESLESLVLTDLPEDAADTAGRYVVRWRGEGALALTGRARDVDFGDHAARFTFTPGEGFVGVQLAAIDAADPIRDITMMREDHADIARAGAVFNPDFLATVHDVRSLRFMDWMATNGSGQVTWDDRPRPDDATFARRGVPVEVMVDLANRAGVDPWFTLPHMADDDYVRRFAQYVHDHLRPGLRANAEWSNEVWNFTFPQAGWAAAQARARWGDAAGDDAWMQYAGTRAAEVADIWAGVFADDPSRLVRVVATHTGWPGLEDALLDAPLRQAEGLPAPVRSFDAYAVSGYFGHDIGAEEFAPSLRAWIAAGEADARVTAALREGSVADLVTRLWPHHARVARERGLMLLMYEGGSHLVGQGAAGEDAAINAFLARYSYSPDIAAIYADLLAAWRASGAAQPVGPFNAFVDIAPPSRWGSWGARRHTGDVNPRWATLAAWNSVPLGEDRGDALRHGVLRRAGDGGGVLAGTAWADVLTGGAGDDVIVAGGGADLVGGGAGHDRVVLPGKAADWMPAAEGDVLWMIGPEAEVRMVDVEEIAFSDDPGAVLTVAAPAEGRE
ncbi:MAG: calcium-binding protein [Rubellimicrobium sp.]|nr:calcium-binding protein [Rubellimicrobium sp.]